MLPSNRNHNRKDILILYSTLVPCRDTIIPYSVWMRLCRPTVVPPSCRSICRCPAMVMTRVPPCCRPRHVTTAPRAADCSITRQASKSHVDIYQTQISTLINIEINTHSAFSAYICIRICIFFFYFIIIIDLYSNCT